MAKPAHVTPANPNFNFTSLLQASQSLEGAYLDVSDDLGCLFSLSPLSSPESTPPPSPSPKLYQPLPDSRGSTSQPLPGTQNAELEASDNLTNPPGHRKARMRTQAKANRRNKRFRDKEENQNVFGHHESRQAVQEKYVDRTTPINSNLKVGEGTVASTGFVGRDVHGRSHRMFELEEVVGVESELKFKLQEWDGKTPMSVVDNQDLAFIFLVGHPDNQDWPKLTQEAAAALEERRSRCSVPEEKQTHRRGAFVALNCGVSYGGGPTAPFNMHNNKANTEVLEELNSMKVFKRLAGFASAVFADRAPKLYNHYVEKLGPIFVRYPHLKRNFKSSVFTAAAYNFGPRTVCYKHADFANLPFGLCAITALGSYDPKKGGHLILWDAHLVIEFPPGSTILIPSAILAHSNVSIGKGETRYSFTQFSAGGLFRWVENGFQTAKKYRAKLTDEQKVAVDKMNSERWALGLSLFPKVKSSTSVPAA